MNIEETERKLRESIAWAQANGWTIAPCLYVDMVRVECCPIGAHALRLEDAGLAQGPDMSAAVKDLGMSGLMKTFTRAFDGTNFDGPGSELRELGRKLAAEFVHGKSPHGSPL